MTENSESKKEQRTILASSDLAKAILGATDLPHEEVFVEAWGQWVRLRGLTGAERDDYEASHQNIEWGKNGAIKKMERVGNARARLLVRCLVDGDGRQVFKPEDAEALGAKSGEALDKLWQVAARLSGIRESDIEEKKGN